MSANGRLRADIVPNLLTLSRFPLSVAVWYEPGAPYLVLALMAAAGLTDVLDGWFARRIRRRYLQEGFAAPKLAHSRAVGAWLDPLADKTFVASIIGVVYFVYQPPLWQIVALFTRELIQLPLLLLYVSSPRLRDRLQFDFTAVTVGKATTVAQFLGLGALMLRHPWAVPLALIAAGFGVLAALAYMQRGVQALSRTDSSQ